MNTSFSSVLTDGKKYLGGSIVGTGNNMELSTNSNYQYGSRKSIESKDQNNITASTSEINHLIISYSKDTKLAINKLG